MKRSASYIFILLLLFNFSACENNRKDRVRFSYVSIMDQEFRKMGREIPFTNEQSVEIDGDVSPDGKFFYYSSNRENGNYDIYLRYLNDITTIRLTGHPSKDINPAVSPDGKYIAFVSMREDPEGDIYIVKLDPEKLIKEAGKSAAEIPTLDKRAKNLTQYQDPVTKTIRIIKDSSPVWSPDGKWIAFSSERSGRENIWIMNIKGKQLKQITAKGGIYPAFSSDGSKIIFVSYRDNATGEIYIKDLLQNSETRITDNSVIELYPGFMGKGNEIIYTLIDKDTNGDKKVDLKDNSVLVYKNLSTGIEYPLTVHSDSSFSAKWYPIYKTKRTNGIIVYSNMKDGNINVSFIPESGIIPKKGNAIQQYNLANRYLYEAGDEWKYLQALERVYHFFNAYKDNESQIYIARALVTAGLKYYKGNDITGYKRISTIFDKLKKKNNFYINTINKYLKAKLKGEKAWAVLQNALERLKNGGKNKYFIPYLIEDLADEYFSINELSLSENLYRKIITDYKKYRRINSIHNKIVRFFEQSLTGELSESVLKILKSGNIYQLIAVKKHLIKIIEREKDINRRLALLGKIEKKYSNEKRIIPLINFAIAKTYLEQKNRNTAAEYFKKTIKQVRNTDLLFYKSNINLGRISLENKNFDEAERYFSSAVLKYRIVWKEPDIHERALWLIRHYETYGERAESSGNYKKAVALYKKYTDLMTFLHIRKIFGKMYDRYAPRSHVLYIDAFIELYGEKKIGDLEKSYSAKKILDKRRLDFDRAYIYGLGYLYTKKGLYLEKESEKLNHDNGSGYDLTGLLEYFKKAMTQIEWAIFLDDTFVEPYILKSWIYQYMDFKRNERGGIYDKQISKYFPSYLWEKNIGILEKALAVNDETMYEEKEGNIHLNMANNYFLLSNYPRALNHYKLAAKYKKRFGAKTEETLFYFHMGYCFWQNGDLNNARNEISKALHIYNSMTTERNRGRYRNQIYTLMKYFALFTRFEKKYEEAIQWYRKLLDFSARYKLKIDKARYAQEIAFCYKELGDYSNALRYLNRAEELLKKYPDDERTYDLRVSIFGILSIPVYDLGQDAAVIGNSKIFTSLSKREKQLLNISMMEDISLKKSDYAGAMKYLKKKIALIKRRDNKIDRESLITALNNLGYYSFVSRNFGDSKKYFKEALKYASDEDINDLPGIFNSLMNLTNLYAYLLEYDPSIIEEPLKEVDDIIQKALSYRSNFEKKTFEEEYKKLKETAKRKKAKVSEDQIANLKNKISEKAKKLYYKIDITVSVLKFYKGELLFNNFNEVNVIDKKDIKEAYRLFQRNRKIYKLYFESQKGFRNALEIAQKKNKRLAARLLINIGTCNEKTGDPDEAYFSYLDALEDIEDNLYTDLKLQLLFKIGNFLNRFAEEIDEGNNLKASLKYYDRAIRLIEEFPFRFGNKIDLIKRIYNKAIEINLELKRWRRALIISEKKYEVVKNLLVRISSPDFFNEADRLAYYENHRKIENIISNERKISALLEYGTPADDEKIKNLKRENLKIREGLKKSVSMLKKKAPLLASLLDVEKIDIPDINGYTIYKLFTSNGRLYIWRIYSGKVSVKSFEIAKTVSFYGRVISYINENSEKSVFIVLNRPLLDMINNGFDIKRIDSFMFVPSVGKASAYLSSENQIISRILSGAKGLKKLLKTESLAIDEEISPDTDYSGYSVIIDRGKNLEPEFLFSRLLSSTFVVKDLKEYNLDYIILFTEAALYSGIKTLFFTKNGSINDFGKIISISARKEFSSVYSGLGKDGNILAVGYKGKGGIIANMNSGPLIEKEYALYKKNFNLRDYGKAGIHLNRWYSLTGGKKNRVKFFHEMSKIYLAQGDIPHALKFNNKALAASKPGTDNFKISLSYNIFLNFYAGNVNKALNMISRYSENNLKEYGDYIIYNAIKRLFESGPQSSFRYFQERLENSTDIKTAININRLKLLLASYFRLFNSGEEIESIMDEWKPDYHLTERDIIFSYYLKGSYEGSYITKNIVSIQKIFTEKRDIKEFIREMDFQINSKLSNTSILPVLVLMSLERFKDSIISDEIISFLSNPDFKNISEKSLWIDKAVMINSLYKYFYDENLIEKALNFNKELIAVTGNRNIRAFIKDILYNYSVLLAKVKKYKESYDTVRRGFKLITKNDNLYVKYQLQLMDCEISLGHYKKARKRSVELLGIKNIKSEDRFILNLLKSKIELDKLSRLKRATVKDAGKFENIFYQSMDIIDKNPEILAKVNRMKLINEILDSFINYKMKTGYHSDALVYAEAKKTINAEFLFPELYRKKFSGGLKNKSDNALLNLLKRYPDLHLKRIIKSIPLKQLQSKLTESQVIIYTIKAGNDIFAWILGKNLKKTEIIKNGYPAAKKLVSRYNSLISKFSSTIFISKELEKLFYPLKKYWYNRKTIYIITDSYLENIPFEILGERTFLSESHTIVYLPSIFSGFNNIDFKINGISILAGSDKKIYNRLEKIAIDESGIDYSALENIAGGFGHIQPPLLYDKRRKKLYVGKNPYDLVVKKLDFLYLPAVDFSGISKNDFIAFAFSGGLSGIIVNDAAVHELNNAFFTGIFYRELQNSADIVKAFEKALYKLKNMNKYKHPAYWAGIRLYVNGL